MLGLPIRESTQSAIVTPVRGANVAAELLCECSGHDGSKSLVQDTRMFEPRLIVAWRRFDDQRRCKPRGLHRANTIGREVVNEAEIVFAARANVDISPIPVLEAEPGDRAHQ